MGAPNENVHKYYRLIKVLKKLSRTNRDMLLPFLNNGSINFLCEVVHNVISSKVLLSGKKKMMIRSALKRNKLCYRTIASQSVPFDERKRLVMQNGRGVDMLLDAAIPSLASITRKKNGCSKTVACERDKQDHASS